MTTSSRKKGILPVRLGLEPDNKTALKEFSEDVDFVKGVLEAFRGFYGNAQSGN